MMCFLLMLTLSEVSDGNNLTCNATKSITCHGVEGEPLYLQVIPNATGYHLVLKNQNAGAIFRYKRDQFMFFNDSFSSSIMQRLHFTAMNGTISINPATKGDSGTYGVEIISEDTGRNVANITIQIIIQDAPSTVTSTNTLITVNDNAKMETPIYMIIASACLGVILLCGAVGVLYVYQRRTHTHKPVETMELEYADASVLKRRQTKQPEQESCKEEMDHWEANLPATSMESPIFELEETVYADILHGE